MQKKQLQDIVDSIRKQTPRGWILMSPNSIGEVLVTCAFARSLIEKTGYPITLCVRPDHKLLVETLYPNRFTAVVGMDMELMRSFSTSGFIPPGHFDIDFPVNLSPLHYGDGRLQDIHYLIYTRGGKSGLTVSDVWRYMLHLDWNTSMERPCADFLKDDSVLDRLDINKEDYILFMPGSNTNKPLPKEFWNNIEKKYSVLDCPSFINIKGSMLVPQGLTVHHAKLIEADVLDALRLIHYSKETVSGGTGLMLVDLFFPRRAGSEALSHVLLTEKYCEKYGLLGTDWENAFTPFDRAPTTYAGMPDVMANCKHVMEWRVDTDRSEVEYEQAAESIFSHDSNSVFLANGDDAAKDLFPRFVDYKYGTM